MSTVVIVASVVVAGVAIAVYSLQSWLEKWDHDRHQRD